jgi:hypothetical protein
MLAGAIVVVGTLLVTSVRASRGVAPVEVGMADILICSTPAVGDLGPLTAIGGHLVSRGHRVRTIAGSRFAETVENARIAHVPLRGAADIDDRDLDAPCLNGGPGAAWPSCATKRLVVHRDDAAALGGGAGAVRNAADGCGAL